MDITKPITFANLKNCSRCGGDHQAVVAKPLTIPVAPPEAGGLAWSHWFPCPTNGEPIMVSVRETDSKIAVGRELADNPEPDGGDSPKHVSGAMDGGGPP